MHWLVYVLFAVFILFPAFVGWLILRAQKELDVPLSGLLLVDRNEDEKTMVYLQINVNPETLKDGQTVKLKAKVVDPDSQLKQARV